MEDNFRAKVITMFRMALARDIIEPDQIFSTILTAWTKDEISTEELEDLHSQTREIRDIDREVRGLENQLKGREPVHRQVLKSAVQELLATTEQKFGVEEVLILEARVKRDLDLTDEFERRS